MSSKAQEKRDRPNWGGNALGTKGVGELAEQSKDSELRTKKAKPGDASPAPEYSPGGPKIKDSLTHEYRSSVDDAEA